jgi:hypothetical protein
MGFSPFIAIEIFMLIKLSVADEFLRVHADVFCNLPQQRRSMSRPA